MRTSVTHLILLFVTVSVTSGNYWSPWTRWSECSRTCDGGATYQTRRCIKSRIYRFKCQGRSIRYATCNNDPCPSGIPDFRAEQCAAYNDASYSGRYFRWLPYHDGSDPCALSCIAEGTKMVAVLAPKVLDGTRCNTHSLDMCINGKCMTVGCDHVLQSKMKVDTCGVCGGNDSCVHDNRGGRYRWVETDFGPCSVSCGVGVTEKRLLCFETFRGKLVDSAYCENLIRPVDSKQTCSMGACPPEWRVGPWQNCTRDCGGGVSWRIVTCLKTFEGGTQQLVRDSECRSVRPSSRKSCNGYICPTWYAGQWSVCSVSCGTGTQEREVVCRHIGDTFCRDTDKPRTIKNCTTGIPCYNMNDYRYMGRRLTGDIQERNIGEFQGSLETNRPQGDQAVTKEDLYQPRFVTTTWDSCSASCGEGVRFRFVRCKVFLQYLNDFADLPDSDCLENEEKPEKFESCMIEPCYDQYERIPAGMTECSKTCLGGIQETILKCVLKENKTEVDDSFCLEAPHVQTERRVCNVKPCPQRWELGEYGECSVSCGVGVKTRSVKCIQEFATVFTLPDVMCNQPIPNREEKCNTHSCPAAWAVGNWSECSVTCGRGVLLRKPKCQRQHDGEIISVSIKECDMKLKPETEKSCIMEECPQAMIKTKDMQFFQLNKMKKLKLVVGMEAHVLPETNIIIKCPHVGLDRQKITWFKNGYKFRRSKRARMSRSGALRIKHARLGKDEGVYSCLVGGLEANVSIAFRTSFSVLQDTVTREKYQRGAKFPGTNLMNGTFHHMDPVARKMRPLTLIGGDWSRCSVSCGGGLQSRNVSCEIITEDYYEVLPKSDCYNQLDMPPLTIQSCGSDPCVTWKTGNWSECSETECVRNQYSIQRRTVECVNEFDDSVTDDKFCRGLGFPPDNIRDCVNMNCTARWNTSKWSECNAECDQTGYKTRMLNCIWANTGQLATAGSCGYQRKPQVTKKCSGKSCSEMECKDESEYCSIVRVMNMCHMENYQVRCCWTCNDDYYYYDAYEDYGDEDVVDEANIS